MIGIRRPTASTREQDAGLLGRVAALERVIDFLLARDVARTREDVLGILTALKAQSLNAAAQAGDAKSFRLGLEQGFESLRTLSAEDPDDGKQYAESRWV